MKVELVYDLDCPNVAAARAQLMRAFSAAAIDATWTEWDRSAANAPAHIRKYGSPTILIDGQDAVPEALEATASSCRLYPGRDGKAERVPSVETLVVALRRGASNTQTGTNGTWRASLAAVPTVGVALLPKLTCPACWPAYAAVMSALGVGFSDYSSYLLPISVVTFAVTLAALAWRARARWGYGPLALGCVATALHLIGKFSLESDAIAFATVPVLVGAAAWNAWPRKNRPESCGSCAST